MTGTTAGRGPHPATTSGSDTEQLTADSAEDFPRMPAGQRPLRGFPSRLRCGVALDELIDQVADDRAPQDPAHQRGCPYCRAALSELHEIWAPVASLIDEPIEAPPSLLGSVMERVGALAANNWHAVVPDPPGRTSTAAWVIAVIARRAAAAVPGVIAVTGRVAPPVVVLDSDASTGLVAEPVPTSRQQDLAAGTGVAGATVVVSLVLTADGTQPLQVLAQRVREQVIAHVRELAGLAVVEVDVLVEDVRLPPVS